MANLQMNLKLSEWLIEIVLYIGYFLILIIPPLLYSWTPIDTSKYLNTQYQRNWNLSYIIDIKTVTPTTSCQTGFEVQTIGYWSGIQDKSCVCTSLVNKLQFATDDINYCNSEEVKLLYSCKELNPIKSANLTKYKTKEFCIKRSTESIVELEHKMKNGTKIEKNDYQIYLQGLVTRNIPIASEAIVDIKIALKASPLEGYTRLDLDDTYSLYIKKKDPVSTSTIYHYNDLIVDIHLMNELSCAYIDMSQFNPRQLKSNKEYINFGGNSYCENFNDKTVKKTKYDLFYHDDFKRTQIINNDYLTTTSLNDIYAGTPIESYYTKEGITTQSHIDPSFAPALVLQRYYYGIGCPWITSPRSHLIQYETMTLCKNIVIAIASFSICAFVFAIIFLIIKLFDSLMDYPCFYCILGFIFMFMVSLSLVMSITYIGLMAYAINYFKYFSYYCQTDYRQPFIDHPMKTTQMELRFITDMELAMSIDIVLIIITAITICFHIGYYFIICVGHSPIKSYQQTQIEMEKLK